METSQNISLQAPDTLWHKSSYLFILAFFILANSHGFIIALIPLAKALLNLKHDTWYKFLWPWIFIVIFSIASLANLATKTIASNYTY